ncbi:sensor histidine kinase [Microseira wollei]|nr:ATP-binding protein [Microseira wollei]
MASLGQLVAGLAPEISNPVNFIYGHLENAHEYTQYLLKCLRLYRQYYQDPAPEIQAFLRKTDLGFLFEDLPRLLQSMQVGTDRIREIVTSLRNFSRIDEAEVKAVNIHEGIDSTLMLLQNRLKPSLESTGIQVVKDYGKLPLVECYPGQLNQVFMNLFSNVINNLEEYKKRRSLEDIKANQSLIRISTSVINKDWVGIYIADNGSGMTEEVRSHLFEPFFITKSGGKGSGLALSISYQIVTDKHGGKLSCNSAPGDGTEFVIEIPVRQDMLKNSA